MITVTASSSDKDIRIFSPDIDRSHGQEKPIKVAEEDRDRSLDYHRHKEQRKYLPTFAELVDRMTIVQLKEIFIQENAGEYAAERKLIEHDLDLILRDMFHTKGFYLTARAIHAICMIMLSNRYMWENESRARSGGDDQDKLLKLTHSINGVRNTAKNVLAHETGERKDMKIDCFAEHLIAEFGQWDVFGRNIE